jgi:RNA polymerase sigma-B factor
MAVSALKQHRPSRVRPKDQALERQLALRYHRDGDLAARRELAERFIPLARDLALRYSYTDEPLDDLVQVACLGLLKAIDRYEPGRGSKFTSYAVPTILGELKRHFRDKGWALHVPRDLQERSLAVARATEKLSATLGRSPKMGEIAEEMGCSVESVLEASEAAATYETASLDAPFSREADEPAALGDMVGGEDTSFSLVETREAMADTWSSLPEVEREVVRLRFVNDLTQREIGDRIGFSQMHVSRLLRRALGELRESAVKAA